MTLQEVERDALKAILATPGPWVMSVEGCIRHGKRKYRSVRLEGELVRCCPITAAGLTADNIEAASKFQALAAAADYHTNTLLPTGRKLREQLLSICGLEEVEI